MRTPAAAETWAASGALALTGREHGVPLVPPDGVIDRMRVLGAPLHVDPLPLLTERAAAVGLRRRGDVSCGGATRLLSCADGWIAVSLARADDVASVPAWLERAVSEDADMWSVVDSAVATEKGDVLVERASLLGMPVSRLDEVAVVAPSEDLAGLPVTATRFAEPSPPSRTFGARAATSGTRAKSSALVVVDLTSLWAGPLCTRLLADRGAAVVKVESARRPDGARRGSRVFFDRLHAGTRSVALDFDSPSGRGALLGLVRRADVVVTASRTRALEQLGLDAEALVEDTDGPRVWVSITGYGRAVDRVAFGDDAAVAGGLVALDGDGPCFVGDAVADPLAGVTAAAAATSACGAGGRWLVDVSMAGVAAFVIGDARGAMWRTDDRLVPSSPTVPATVGAAPEFGADTHAVLHELGLTST